LISLVVNQVVFQNIAPGPLVIYFNGTKNNNLFGFNFLTNASALGNLFNHLVSFFGAALNCTDGSIPPYATPPAKTMPQAHATLQIGYQDFTIFNQYVLNVLGANGVVASDLVLVAKLLNSLNPNICYLADCQTICNKYSIQGVLNNTALMTTIVVNTFLAAVANGVLIPFFNGSITYAGVTNYLTNATAQGILVSHLVQYFGMNLGCSDGTIGAYQGVSMPASHAILPINNAAFTTFNTALVGVLATLGVSAADQATVAAFLEGLRPSICYQPDCVLATTVPSSVPVVTTAKKADAGTLVPAVAMLAGALAVNLF